MGNQAASIALDFILETESLAIAYQGTEREGVKA